MKVFWATKLRGFLKHLSEGLTDVEFAESTQYYEVNKRWHRILSKIIRLKIFDLLGIFKVVTISGKDCDIYGSFNSFLKSDKPYFIYLENPLALYHYSIKRISYRHGKHKFEKCLNDKNLKGIICMSDACKNSFEKINGNIPDHIFFGTIYPFVPNNKNVSYEIIKNKSAQKTIELLYCVQGVRFVSKGGLETLEALSGLQDICVHLTVITKISDVDKKIIKKIKSMDNVDLYDFSFAYSDLEKIYARTNILIQPTSDDSVPLTVLEAMKGGCAVISSRLYAIPEMVAEAENGFLIDPKYWFFDRNNIPNPRVWNHREKTIYSTKIDEDMVGKISDRIRLLYEDRKLLEKLSMTSFKKATDDSLFGEDGIAQRWKHVLCEEIDLSQI